MYFLAECNISPLIVEHAAFREMIAAAQQNSCAAVASRHEFRKGGVYLSAAQTQSAKVRSQGLSLLKARGTAGCLLQDAVKSIKRTTVNHVLQTPDGVFHVKHSTPGATKKTAQYLADEVISCILMLGDEFIFLIIMDGASVCIAAMRIVRERFRHVFSQRCSTHGISLLLAAICKFFKEQIRLVVQIIVFVNNHEALYTSLRDDGAKALFHGADSAETRMAKEL